ncbi:MAG: PEP-CTERM sorting domain-containing protein, partial [Myxococcales bacterium]|nr:PEP-CTERM sorting domain-containing protein [Myxococcales bacterium]
RRRHQLIQLVTPALTRWVWAGISPAYTGHIGILKIQVPEPDAVLLLAVGTGALLALRRLGRRR